MVYNLLNVGTNIFTKMQGFNMTAMIIEEIIRLDKENPGWGLSGPSVLHSMILQHVTITEEKLLETREKLLDLCKQNPDFRLDELAEKAGLEYNEMLAYLFFPLGG